MSLTNPNAASDMSALDAEAHLYVEQHSRKIVGLDFEMARGILVKRGQTAVRVQAVTTRDPLLRVPVATDSLDPFEREARARLRNPSRIDQRNSSKRMEAIVPSPESSVVQEIPASSEIVASSVVMPDPVAEERAAVGAIVGEVTLAIAEELPDVAMENPGMHAEVEEDPEGPTPEQLVLLEQQPDVDADALMEQDVALYGDEYTADAVDEMVTGDDYESAESGNEEFEDIDFETLGIDPGEPTTGKPGSEEKILMLAARYAVGVPLWNNMDAGHGKTDEDDLMSHKSPNRAH